MILRLTFSSPDGFLLQRLSKINHEQQNFPEYHPQDYNSEGTNTDAVSLDKLSFHSTKEGQNLLHNLGPRFNNLEEICQDALKEKNIKLWLF